MSSSKLEESSRRLCELSSKSYLNPFTYIDWPAELNKEAWFTTPDLISAQGTQSYEKLSLNERQILSFYEAVNFFSLNIHGEKALVEGLAQRLYSKELLEFTPYLHHFLDEENKHMIYFGGFCSRYAAKVYRDRKIVFQRDYAPGEKDFLFFARVMIFEEIVDAHNLIMANDEQLHELARKINLIHHLEEVRHLVFGRQICEYLFDKYKHLWTGSTLASIRSYLRDYIVATWKEYYNPDVYRDAQISDPYGLVEESWNRNREHRQKISKRVCTFLKEREMIAEDPEL